jgi:hypothetical protein
MKTRDILASTHHRTAVETSRDIPSAAVGNCFVLDRSIVIAPNVFARYLSLACKTAKGSSSSRISGVCLIGVDRGDDIPGLRQWQGFSAFPSPDR